MKRKITALCLLVIMLLSLTACKNSSSVMTVSGQEISGGVFAYYLDKVMSKPQNYGVEDNMKESILSACEELCKKYAVTISYMNEKGITLSTQMKQAVATDTENLWNLYSKYYESIGVGKPDLTKVITHEYRLKQIVEHFFGAGGSMAVSEDLLKEEFVDLYIGFKAVRAELTKISDMGEKIDLTQGEADALEKKFRAYAEKINSADSTIDEVNVSYNDSLGLITTEDLEITLIKKGDPMYGVDFFNKVMDISHNRAGVVKDGKTLYLIQRMKIATTEEDAFVQYRSEVLEEIKMPEVEAKINSLAQKAEAEMSKRRTEKIYGALFRETEDTE